MYKLLDENMTWEEIYPGDYLFSGSYSVYNTMMLIISAKKSNFFIELVFTNIGYYDESLGLVATNFELIESTVNKNDLVRHSGWKYLLRTST